MASNDNNNKKTDNRYRTLQNVLVAILRILIGGVFIYSGFVKGVDIWGLQYKVEDYLNVFGWTWALPLSSFVSVVLPLFEFVMGGLLLLGSFRRATVIVLLLCMLVMLPLSFYVMIANPVADCGCFGDAWVISNTATFVKNIFITAGLVWLLKANVRLRSLFGPAVQWLTALLPGVFLIYVAGYGNFVQPMLDFRPYKLGTSVVAPETQADDDDFVFVYEKDGIRKEFTIDNLPDSTWTFVDRHERAQTQDGGNAVADYRGIPIYDGDEEISSLIIPRKGEAILILMSDMEEIDALTSFRLNDLNDLAAAEGVPMICLTGSSDEQLSEWRELSLSFFPVYHVDGKLMTTIARGNPAVVWLKDGVIRYKSTFDALYDHMEAYLSGNKEEKDVVLEEGVDARHTLIGLSLLLVVSLSLLLLINRSPLLIKFGLRLRKNQNNKVSLSQKKDLHSKSIEK